MSNFHSRFSLLALVALIKLASCVPAYQGVSSDPAERKDENSFETEELKLLELESDNKALSKENVKLRNENSSLKAQLEKQEYQFQSEVAKYQQMVEAIEKEAERSKQAVASRPNKNFGDIESIAKEPDPELTLDLVVPTPLSSKAVKTATLSNSTESGQGLKASLTKPATPFSDPAINPPLNPIKVTSVPSAKSEYDKAYSLYLKKRYLETIEAFSIFLRRFANDNYADNALFWLGMTYWHNGDAENSSRYFREMLTKYSHGTPKEGSKTADAIYMLGKISKEKGDESQALYYFKAVRDKYPGTIPAQYALKEAPELEVLQ